MFLTGARTVFVILFLSGFITDLAAQPEYKYIPREHDWFSYDVSTLLLETTPAGYEQEGWSNSHTLSFIKDILLGKSKFSIGLGLAYTSHNLKSNTRISVDENTGEASFTLLNPDSVSYQRNKLNAKYLEIPVEFRFRTKPNDNGRFFRVYLGFRGGVRFSSYALYENDETQVRYYHPAELNRWSAGTYLKLGYGALSIYGCYSLMPLFDYEASPRLSAGQINLNNLIPVALGLSLSI